MVLATVDFQVWYRDYAMWVGSAEFDCTRALDELPLDEVKSIEVCRADYDTDNVYYIATKLGLVKEHDGPFDCYIVDEDELLEYIAQRGE